MKDFKTAFHKNLPKKMCDLLIRLFSTSLDFLNDYKDWCTQEDDFSYLIQLITLFIGIKAFSELLLNSELPKKSKSEKRCHYWYKIQALCQLKIGWEQSLENQLDASKEIIWVDIKQGPQLTCTIRPRTEFKKEDFDCHLGPRLQQSKKSKGKENNDNPKKELHMKKEAHPISEEVSWGSMPSKKVRINSEPADNCFENGGEPMKYYEYLFSLSPKFNLTWSEQCGPFDHYGPLFEEDMSHFAPQLMSGPHMFPDLRGIQRVGQTCYINVVVMLLLCIHPFKNFLNITDVAALGPLLLCLKELYQNCMPIEEQYSSWTLCLSNQDFITSFNDSQSSDKDKINTRVQGDGVYFFNRLIESVDSEIAKIPGMPNHFIEQRLESFVQYQSCGHGAMPTIVSHSKRVFTFTPITEDSSLQLLLDKSFVDFLKPDGCSLCKKVRTTSSQNLVLPEYLCLHTPRNDWDSVKRRVVRCEGILEVKTLLRVNEDSYNLIGVIIHNGGASSGHYTFIMKNLNCIQSDAWYEVNDDQVTQLSASIVLHEFGKNGVFFLYKKREA